MKTRSPWFRLAVLVLLCCVLAGCVGLQNEFFVFDLAPPVPESPAGTEAGS